MNEKQIKEIEKRLSKTTKGIWKYIEWEGGNGAGFCPWGSGWAIEISYRLGSDKKNHDYRLLTGEQDWDDYKNNGKFLAHAKNDISKLLKEIRALKGKG